MTSYVDVDLSEEALQEDVELQEAVEQIVQKGAEIIIEDVRKDVNGVYEQSRDVILGLFPFIITWVEDHGRFWTDMEHLSIAICLFVFFFWFLTPWSDSSSSSSRNLRSAETSRKRSMERSKSLSSIRRIKYSINRKSRSIADEIEEEGLRFDQQKESEAQKFAKRWPAILSSSQYRSLVLPPECKRVDKPHLNKRKEQGTTNQKVESLKKSTNNFTDENPGTRLINYMKEIFHLIVLFRRYDYTGAGRTLIIWIQSVIRARNSKSSQGEGAGMEDDEDEDESVASDFIAFQNGKGHNLSDSKTKTRSSKRSKSASRTMMRSKKEKTEVIKSVSTNDQSDHRDDDHTANISSNLSKDDDSNNDTARTENCSSKDLSDVCSLRSIDLDNIENEPSKQNLTNHESLSVDETVTKTPPRVSLDSENQPFFTPLHDKHVAPNVRTPPSTLIPPMSLSKSSLPIIRSRSLATGAKTRDALASYRIETSRKDFQLNSTPPSSSPELRLSPPSTESTASFFFETAGTHESIRRMAVEVPVPDNNGYILGDEFLPDKSFTPLLVFVNSRSGPQQGHLLTTQLRGLLNPIQIWDLADGGPEEILESFSTFSRLRILVCGGDGTVSWIVSTIESMEMERWPPIAILPLGTGNDLARVHGWGGGYSNEPLIKILEQVSEGYASWLDRWEMTKENKKGKVRSVQSFLNYLSVGADAQAALQVHMLRESRPQLFFSRMINKLWYLVFGAEDIIQASSINLRHDIILIADGIEVPIPNDSQGIIMLNIDSYTGGVPLWATGDTMYDTQTSDIANHNTDGFGVRVLKKRSKSFDDASNIAKSYGSKISETNHTRTSLYRTDSVEDLASLSLTDDERYTRLTACDRPSSCQDGLLDIVSVRGTFHLGQIRVGLSTAQKLCQCREATIIIKRQVAVQIDGEPWRENVCTLRIRRKKDAAIMLHRSADESNGVETEMANLLDWAKNRHLIDGKVHEAMMKEFSRRIEDKTRQRRVQSNDNLMTHLKRAINSAGSGSNNNHASTSTGAINGAGINF